MKRSLNICAIGDSLIKAKSDNLLGWAYHFSKKTSILLDRKLNYFNEGVGGDTSKNIIERYELSLEKNKKWDIVILGVGINDSRKRGNPPIQSETLKTNFELNLTKLVERINSNSGVSNFIVAGIIPVIEALTTPFKEDKYYYFEDGIEYLNIQKSIIEKFDSNVFIDFNNTWKYLSIKEKIKYMNDGLHPNAQGHLFLANIAFKIAFKQLKLND